MRDQGMTRWGNGAKSPWAQTARRIACLCVCVCSFSEKLPVADGEDQQCLHVCSVRLCCWWFACFFFLFHWHPFKTTPASEDELRWASFCIWQFLCLTFTQLMSRSSHWNSLSIIWRYLVHWVTIPGILKHWGKWSGSYWELFNLLISKLLQFWRFIFFFFLFFWLFEPVRVLRFSACEAKSQQTVQRNILFWLLKKFKHLKSEIFNFV